MSIDYKDHVYTDYTHATYLSIWKLGWLMMKSENVYFFFLLNFLRA